MTDTAAQTAATIMQSAVEFMAHKANVTTEEIAQTIIADPHGNTARYFRDLLRAAAEFMAAR